jgi:5'-nucleotidase
MKYHEDNFWCDVHKCHESWPNWCTYTRDKYDLWRTKEKCEQIALFDLDGTLCDYDEALEHSMKSLQSPQEPEYEGVPHDDAPLYLRNRANLIRAFEDWWVALKPFKLGFDILNISKEIGYHPAILTQGPKLNPAAWSGKKKWIDAHLGHETDIIITRDKGLVYGKVLVDDFPKYILRWLRWRPRGLVIMPAQKHNENFTHPQVLRYTGKNKKSIYSALKERYQDNVS